MLRHLILLYPLVALASTAVAAQEPRMAFAPSSPNVVVVSDVEYATSGTTRLAMDLYKPPLASGARAPALVFFNRATGADRSGRFYAAWARAAASKGLIGILPDLRSGSEASDFTQLVAYLSAHGAEHGIDGIAVYAASGNVFNALPVVQDPTQTSIKAAVIYYGSAPVSQFRLDLPILYVRAGLDRPPVNESIASLVALATAQNAPVTLLNYAGGHHGFELVDDTDATRQIIDETLDFVKRATSASYQAALHASLGEAAAAGYVQTRKFTEAAEAYARLVAARPDDARLRLAYGEALLGDARFVAACTEFDKLRDKGLGYRDLGLPAARACLGKGDPDAAVAWLKTIPPQFLPATMHPATSVAARKDRRDNQALFMRR